MRTKPYEPYTISRDLERRGYGYMGPEVPDDWDEAEYEAERARLEPKEGSRVLLYVNAYSVTRHFGGREEGGWWYNAGEPLASIPVRAKYSRNPDGQMAIFPISWRSIQQEIRRLERDFAYVQEGDIYSVLGGTALEILVETHPAEYWPSERPHYE